MKKIILLLAFMTIFFVSYGKTIIVNTIPIQEFKELPKETLPNLNDAITSLSVQRPNELPKKNIHNLINQISRNFYEFEVTTSCGPVISVIQYCDCDYWQLMAMASNIGLGINQQACPDDTPGSQHVRIMMP